MINIMSYISIIIMTILGAFAGLFLKKSSSARNIKEILLCLNLYIGGILYLISAFINIYVLKILDYSVVLPLTSITYIWTMIISHIYLKENINSKKIIGVILIFLGAIIVTLN